MLSLASDPKRRSQMPKANPVSAEERAAALGSHERLSIAWREHVDERRAAWKRTDRFWRMMLVVWGLVAVLLALGFFGVFGDYTWS
jgi:anti-sigma-K factor RskA